MSKKFLLSLAVLLSACGQKGPLYLPQDAAVPAQPTATGGAMMPVPASTAPAATSVPSAEDTSAEEKQRKAEDKRPAPSTTDEVDFEK